jgi:hypothetical protein
MQSLQEVITLNNEGARLLQSGSTMEALYLFRTAVVLLKQFPLAIPTVESCTRHAPSTPGPTPCISPVVQLPNKDDSDMILEETVSHSPQSLHDGTFYVHYRPLIIPENFLVSSEDHCELVQLLTTFVLFNLAIACHHYGKVTGTEAPVERAKELYRIVLTSRDCGLWRRSRAASRGFDAVLGAQQSRAPALRAVSIRTQSAPHGRHERTDWTDPMSGLPLR